MNQYRRNPNGHSAVFSTFYFRLFRTVSTCAIFLRKLIAIPPHTSYIPRVLLSDMFKVLIPFPRIDPKEHE